MARQGVIISKGAIGTSINANADATSALVATGVAVDSKLALDTVYQINNIKEADILLGINATYDTTNKVRIYRHIAEFYRLAGAGVPLYIAVAAQSKTPGDLLDDLARKVIVEAKGAVRQLAIAYNPVADYESQAVDGLDGNVRAALNKAVDFADWSFQSFRQCHVVLEGRGLNGTAEAALNLRNITANGSALQGTKVTLMVGQDYLYAETQDTIGKQFADVGTLLGAIAKRPVNQDIGEVGVMNITDTGKPAWLQAGLSNHNSIEAEDANLDTYDEKGYVFCWSYQSEAVSGVRFNGDHVCAPVIEDEEGNINAYSIALSRTEDKVIRKLRDAYLPKVRSSYPVETATGLLPLGIVKYLESIGNDVFSDMVSAGELSGGLAVVDRNSKLVGVGDKSLNVSFEYVPYGSINVIKGSINIKSKI